MHMLVILVFSFYLKSDVHIFQNYTLVHVNSTEENALHIINDCPAFTRTRQLIFGTPTLDFIDLTNNIKTKHLINKTNNFLTMIKFSKIKPPYRKPHSPHRK